MTELSEEVHEECVEDSFKRLFWDQQLKTSSVKDSWQVWCHPAIIMWCLNLNFISYHAYYLAIWKDTACLYPFDSCRNRTTVTCAQQFGSRKCMGSVLAPLTYINKHIHACIHTYTHTLQTYIHTCICYILYQHLSKELMNTCSLAEQLQAVFSKWGTSLKKKISLSWQKVLGVL